MYLERIKNHVRALHSSTGPYCSLRNLSLQAAAAAASDLDEYFEPSLHELNQMALIHYKTEFNRVLASVGLPPSAGVTAAGSQVTAALQRP